VRDVIRFALSRFKEANVTHGQGTSNPIEETTNLVMDCLHLEPLSDDETSASFYLDCKLTSSELKKVLGAIHLRTVSRIPTPYITNLAHFGEFSFFVDQRVIIPRSLIAEILLQEELLFLKNSNKKSIQKISQDV